MERDAADFEAEVQAAIDSLPHDLRRRCRTSGSWSRTSRRRAAAARPVPGRPADAARRILRRRAAGQDHDLPRPARALLRRRRAAPRRDQRTCAARGRAPLRHQRRAPHGDGPVRGPVLTRSAKGRGPATILRPEGSASACPVAYHLRETRHGKDRSQSCDHARMHGVQAAELPDDEVEAEHS